MGAALADISPDVPTRRLPRPRLLVDLYSFVINTGHELSEVLSERAPQFLDEGELIADVFKRYLGRKRQADLMDFDDLLLNWLLAAEQVSASPGRAAGSASITSWWTSTRTPIDCRRTSSTGCSGPTAT